VTADATPAPAPFAAEVSAAREALAERVTGRVGALRGLTLEVTDLPLPVGAVVEIPDESGPAGHHPRVGEIVGFHEDRAIVMLLGHAAGVRPGHAVVGVSSSAAASVGPRLLGRVLDGMGRPIDGGPAPAGLTRRPLDPPPMAALSRARITQHLHTGVRAVDLMTPVGVGQRLGLFAGPGVGKSTLLGQLARGSSSDVNLIALIGERGREVREFIEDSLGAEGLARSVVVVATGDESPLLRIRAAKLALTAAEYFRDLGKSVLLMMDSVTRFAHAQRQIGLSVGEPPASKGYTPSVFGELAGWRERAGGDARSGGAITGLYTILVEGDDMTEPISDAARGILDGHLALSRTLAQKGHFPAIDVLDSVSRVADLVTTDAHRAARRHIGRLLALYGEVEELVRIGAYARGSDAETDVAIELKPAIDDLLRQRPDELSGFEATRERMTKLAMQSGEMIGRAGQRRQG